MTLMWRHRNRPGVPERDVELAGPPLEDKTVNYPPKGGEGSDSATVSTPAKSWTKEKIQDWAAEEGVELTPGGTKEQWLTQIEEEWADDPKKPAETPSGAGETPPGAASDGTTQETGDPTNAVNPEGVQPNGEGNA